MAASSALLAAEYDINHPSSTSVEYSVEEGDRLIAQHPQGNGATCESWRSVSLRAPKRLYRKIRRVIVTTFLPVGYPHTVRPEYLSYQLWDTLQALCSYLRGILTTKAILEGVGVGSEKASALSAAMNWVFRDGISMACSLAFSSFASTDFDANVKEWRLFADIINDVGLLLDMLTSVYREQFLLLTCLGTICKTLCGVAAGCTKNNVTAYFAVAGNIADVSAKESAQETAVSLLGIIGGLAFARSIAAPDIAWPVFLFLTAVHVYANFQAVIALRLRTLNSQRSSILLRAAVCGLEAHPLTPDEVAGRERVWRPLLRWALASAPILGARLGQCFRTSEELATARKIYSRERYILWLCQDGRVRVLLNEGSGVQDELKALYQHEALMHLSSSLHEPHTFKTRTDELWPSSHAKRLLTKSYEMTVHQFPRLWDRLTHAPQNQAWDLSRLLVSSQGWRIKLDTADTTVPGKDQ